MMKTKIIFSVIVLCLITACSVTSSKKTKNFNPENINGFWVNTAISGNPSVHGHDFYYSFLYVNYPYLQGCTTFQTRSHSGYLLLDSALTKEKLKVVYIKNNYYRVKRINGNLVNHEDTKVIDIDVDFNPHNDTYLTIYKIKDGKKSQQSPKYTYNASSPDSDFQNCLKNAKDTTSIFLY